MRGSQQESEYIHSGAACQSPLQLLIVDADAQRAARLMDRLADLKAVIQHVTQIEDARACLAGTAVDLVMCRLDDAVPAVLSFAEQLRAETPVAQVMLIAERTTVGLACRAMQIGAADLVVGDVPASEWQERVAGAVKRWRAQQDRLGQVDRLQSLCDRLAESRDEISQQVDLLCTDLVVAYQDLAAQINHADVSGQYWEQVGHELDLEEVLRQTLKFMVDRLGPTNAAVFLPNHTGGFVVGGYVNFNCDRDSADMLLQHLADVAAGKIARSADPIHYMDNAMIEQWIGDDATYLLDCQVIGVNCCHEAETLASLMLFRDVDDPYPDDAVEMLEVICSHFASHLARLTRVHHRLQGLFDDTDGYEAA